MKAVVCLAGGIASGKTTLARALVESLPRVQGCSFGDVVREEATARGRGSDRDSLQAVGMELVAEGWPAFVDRLLVKVPAGVDVLVVEGIRHVEPVVELRRRFPSSTVRLVYLDADPELIRGRIASRGEVATALGHAVESSLGEVARFADLRVDTSVSVDDALSRILGVLKPAVDASAADSRGGDVARLMQDLRTFADARGWTDFHNPKNLVLALTGEVGELAALFQWLTPGGAAEIMRSPDLATQVQDELADVLVHALYLCNQLELDPIEIVDLKMARNAGRFPV
jgi:NTP pyrophosphatase (non-canonical NTP hydrolase)/dephospho-CoA kinase